jgi:signal transduction histidine kinase
MSTIEICKYLKLALYLKNYNQSTEGLEIHWLVDDIHQRIGNFNHRSDNYIDIVRNNTHPNDVDLIHTLKNNILGKESSILRTYRLLIDDHSYRPFVEKTRVTTRSETATEFVGCLFMAPKFETDMENDDNVEQQLLGNLRKEQQMNQAKSLFVNMVSHEMPTPLAIIQGAVELIECSNDKLSDMDRSNYVQSIKSSFANDTNDGCVINFRYGTKQSAVVSAVEGRCGAILQKYN